MNVKRPTPVGTITRRKRVEPAFSGEQLGAYRRVNGISQDDLATNLGVKREAVTMAEGRAAVGEETGTRYLDAVDYLVRRRQEVVASGVESARRLGLVTDDGR